MPYASKKATFTASAGPVTVTWGVTFSGTNYAVIGCAPVSATFVRVRFHNKTTTTVDVSANASFTGDVHLFAFE